MQKGKENTQGRGLEYAFVEAFLNSFPQATVEPPETVASLKVYFDACSPDLQGKYRRACTAYWAKYPNPGSFRKAIMRFTTDAEAQRRGVPDLRLILDDISGYVSVKHNHSALRHQRVPSTMQHLGFRKDSAEDIDFRSKLDRIMESIQHDIGKHFEMPCAYKSMGTLKEALVYRPIMALVAETLQRYSNDLQAVRAYFNFLSGGDHMKVIVRTKTIDVHDFRDLQEPRSMQVTFDPDRPAYSKVLFDTGFCARLRIHNDEREYRGAIPTKIDTQPCEKAVPEEVLSF